MFRIVDGYFDKITCPQLLKNSKCTILNCIFNHTLPNSKGTTKKRSLDQETTQQPKKRPALSEVTVNDTADADNEKKKSIVKDSKFLLPKPITHLQIDRTTRTINTRKIAKLYQDDRRDAPNKHAIEKEYELAIGSKTTEEYNAKITKVLGADIQVDRSDPKYILPKEVVPTPPATLQERKKFIQVIVDTIKKVQPDLKTPVLIAIDEEYKIASSATKNTYSQLIKKRVYEINNPEKFKKEAKIHTEADYLKKLEEIVISEETLAKYGYIMEVPVGTDPEQKRVCRRCSTEFMMYNQLNPTQCHYHWGKPYKKDSNSRVYACCGGIAGGDSDTCSVSEYHVFHWSNPEEMQSFLPFKSTSEIFKPKQQSFKAIGIDCEMGYTTKGFELLRITALDFFTGEEVLDVLVKPLGEVIDLNTKWSGISEIKEEALTFNESIDLLGEVMDSNTILIGHGLENDLNSMRLLHKRVIDTAILYPKHKTSPTFRFPLKYLTFKYLGRTIQTGEHDSSEDSLAAIDVVKYFVNLELNS